MPDGSEGVAFLKRLICSPIDLQYEGAGAGADLADMPVTQSSYFRGCRDLTRLRDVSNCVMNATTYAQTSNFDRTPFVTTLAADHGNDCSESQSPLCQLLREGVSHNRVQTTSISLLLANVISTKSGTAAGMAREGAMALTDAMKEGFIATASLTRRWGLGSAEASLAFYCRTRGYILVKKGL